MESGPCFEFSLFESHIFSSDERPTSIYADSLVDHDGVWCCHSGSAISKLSHQCKPTKRYFLHALLADLWRIIS